MPRTLWTCSICGKVIVTAHEFYADHITPVSEATQVTARSCARPVRGHPRDLRRSAGPPTPIVRTVPARFRIRTPADRARWRTRAVLPAAPYLERIAAPAT
jgi:hypothetical protein